ncbi:MAG: FAD-dependent monooxygenase [Alphaproteobacteria bacterium]|nr:FAD-dependent monooxygenase [Alphaproteobacteria bacterium]
MLDLDYRRLYDPGQVPQIMRDDLQTVLHDRARDLAHFRFSDGVRSMAQDGGRAQVTFDSGAEAEYDAVIGADGLRSAVRDQVLGRSDYRLHPLNLQAAAFTCENVLGLQNEYVAHLEPMRHSIVYTTRRNELSCILFFAPHAPVPGEAEPRLDYLRGVFEDAPAPVQEVLTTRARGALLYMDDLMQVRAARWSAGCAAIVGDAAHCLTQLSGIGASMAMASASALARALLAEDPASAGRRLERAIKPQVESLQRKTRRNAKWCVPRSGGLNALRAALLAGAPEAVWRFYFRAKYARS